MKVYHLILGGLIGSIAGAVGAWLFVFNALMPWLALPAAWSNLAGLVAYLFFFAEVGIALGVVAVFGIALLLALLVPRTSEEAATILNSVKSWIRNRFARR